VPQNAVLKASDPESRELLLTLIQRVEQLHLDLIASGAIKRPMRSYKPDPPMLARPARDEPLPSIDVRLIAPVGANRRSYHDDNLNHRPG
jgi:hypothetical protein